MGQNEREVLVERKGRYFVHHNRTNVDAEEPVWLVMHGYGELADAFLRRTTPILEGKPGMIIAPEGLSRFYVRGGRGEIGASWMTSLDRNREIEEYLKMIDRILEIEKITRSVRLNLLGFSQGGATAMRVALHSGRPIGRLVLWGSGFEESELADHRDSIELIQEVVIVQGENDRIVRSRVTDETADALRRLGVRLVVRRSHPGGHDLDEDVLSSLGENMK